MPVHVGAHVAQAGKIDLVGLEKHTKGGFGGENDTHDFRLLSGRKVGHLAHMALQDDATKTRIVRVINTHDTAQAVFPK